MILVTGHMGFIGSKLFEKVEAIGIDVREGNNLISGTLPLDISLIYHLAAQSSVEASWNDPIHDSDNLKMVVRLAKEYPLAKIVYANSCASIKPESPYGFSKRVAGEYLQTFHPNTVNCVLPNIFGEGSRSVVDIFKGNDHVTIYGDGGQTRDYVHVDDIVEGLLKASKWLAGTYFLGSGRSTTVLELAKGKNVAFAEPRREPREVLVQNTTPNWTPQIGVFEYLYEQS